MKIFQEQTSRLTRAFGEMFIPILQQVLPYLNAIVMVLTEIFSFIAGLLGFEQQNFGGAVSDSVSDLEEQLNGATGSAGKLKDELSGLRSFDKLNVINTPSAGGGGTIGGSGLTSVDQSIMDALKKSMSEYEDMMSSVQTKASKIRDNILEWLGFTKKINPFTGDISWEYEGINKTLKNMWNSFKGLNTIGKIFVGLGIAKVFGLILASGKKIFSLIGLSKSSKLLGSVWQLGSYFFTLYKNTGMLNNSWDATIKDNKELLTGMNGLKTVISGVIQVGLGLNFFVDTFKSIKDGTFGVIDAISLVAGAILTISGSIAVVTPIVIAFGGTMTATWAAATAGISLIITALAGIAIAIGSSKNEIDEYNKKIEEMNESANKNYESSLVQIECTKVLANELETLVDINGKVKSSDENRVNFILNKLNEAYGTEYKLIDGAITKKGKEIESNDELVESIDKVMKKKQAEAYLNAYQDVYYEAIRRNNEITQEAYKLQEGKTKLTKTEQKKLQELEAQYRNNEGTIKKYRDLEYAMFEGNIKKIEKVAETFTTASGKSFDELYDNVDKLTGEINSMKFTPVNFEIEAEMNTKEIDDFAKKYNNSTFGYNSQFKLPTFGYGFSAYKDGGMPSVGQMFIANESGPELIGNIGGKSVVANENQVLKSVRAEIASKTANNNKQPINLTIQVGTESIGQVMLESFEEIAKTNGKPIVIGG